MHHKRSKLDQLATISARWPEVRRRDAARIEWTMEDSFVVMRWTFALVAARQPVVQSQVRSSREWLGQRSMYLGQFGMILLRF